MWLKCPLYSKNCFFTLLTAIFFELLITRTPDNSNFFSISLEGSSYRESTVRYFISLLTQISICSNFNLVPMQKPAKGGPIPRFAHDKRDPWGQDSWHLVPKAYLTAGGVTEACGPRRCTKGSRPLGTKLRVMWFWHVSDRCRTTCITCRFTSALKRRKVTFRTRRRETTTENKPDRHDRPCLQGLLIFQYGCCRTRLTQGCPRHPYNASISSGAHNSPVEF